jgi:hypothetical protein
MGVMLYEPEGIAGAWGKLLARIRARNNLTVAESAESNR